MAKQFTLGKNERLKSRKQIELLFATGKTMTVSPFKIFFLINKENNQLHSKSVIQFGAGVSAKNFKRAVDRNRIKRLLRESFRLQKIILSEKLKEKELQLNVFFIYIAKELPAFDLVKEKTAVVLKKLSAFIDENISSHS